MAFLIHKPHLRESIMNILRNLSFIALIGLTSNFCLASQEIATTIKTAGCSDETASNETKTPWLNSQNEDAARKIIESYTSELFAQTPPSGKSQKIALWLDKKIKSDVESGVEFVPGNYNPEPEEFIALAHVIAHYPNHSLKIFQALRASEKAEMANLDVKHAFMKEHPESLKIIIAIGYSRKPQWLENDLLKTFLVPFEKSKDRKFICSKDAYEKRKSK